MPYLTTQTTGLPRAPQRYSSKACSKALTTVVKHDITQTTGLPRAPQRRLVVKQ
jgi:hypothetical protein